eukprot:11188082-Lingulodinium_polyedra.AAC.1
MEQRTIATMTTTPPPTPPRRPSDLRSPTGPRGQLGPKGPRRCRSDHVWHARARVTRCPLPHGSQPSAAQHPAVQAAAQR